MKGALAVLLLAAACSGGGSSSATFNGSVHGQTLTPSQSISSPATVSLASGNAPVAAIMLSDSPSLCGKLGLNQAPQSARVLLIFLSDVNAATGAIQVPAGTATYTVFVVSSGNPSAHFAVASFGVNDSACHQIAAQSAAAISGTVTLTGNAGGTYMGTYDLSFDSGDRVTGSFDTAVCQSVASFLASNTHGCG
jgi:hypothetical protein